MKKNRNIYLMYAIALLQGMVFYGPVATLYRQSAGISVFQITLIESISLLCCMVLEMPWGVVADRIGYKKTMIFCCMLYVVSKVVFWKADSFCGFLMERIMLSVIMAGLSGCDQSILYLSCKEGESHKVFGIYNNLSTAGLLMAACVYSVWMKEDYRLAGFLTVVTYAAAAVLSLGLAEVKEKVWQHEKRRFLQYLLEVLRDRRLLLMLVGMAFLAETNQTVTVFLNQLQYARCGITPASMGYIYIAVTIAGMAGVWSVSATKKMGKCRMIIWTFGAAALSCFILMWTKNPWISIGGVILLRISASMFLPLQQELLNRHVKSADRATVLSIYAVMMEGCGVATNLLFGSTAQKGLPFALGLGGLFCMAGLGLLFYGKSENQDGCKGIKSML